jgi:peptidoglycan/LPS O-acetylase OafA/YrhL
MVCSVLRFHTSVTYPWTLDIFAIIVAFWLKREIVTWQHRSPFRPLELGGLFSYSIYLVHLHGFAFYTRVGISPNSPIILEWLWRLIFVLALCFVFYKIVEQPSHRLARWLYHVLMARRPQKSENLLQRQHEGLQ